MIHAAARLPVPALNRELVFTASEDERCLAALYFLAETAGLAVRRLAAAVPPASVAFLSAGKSGGRDGWQTLSGPANFPGYLTWHPRHCNARIRLNGPLSRINLLQAARRAVGLGVLSLLPAEAFLLHGALLEFPESAEGVLLFGEGGIGKSSTCSRFRRQGGTAEADDQILLSRDARGGWQAQPLPTWSDWVIPGRGRPVRSFRPVRLTALLQLTRGEADRIAPAVPLQWQMGLLRALSFHFRSPAHFLPPERRKALLEHAFAQLDSLRGHFGCHELQAGLHGPALAATLRQFTGRTAPARSPLSPSVSR